MNERPMLHKILNTKTFVSYYYMKQELVLFCRQEGLQTTGGKEELTDRIAYYLNTGKKKISKQVKKTSHGIAEISEDSIIEENIVCSDQHRAFFKLSIGDGFSFNVLFQKWLKLNAGKTYKDAIQSYYQILEDKKKGTTKIAKVFEYNTYIRDFFKDNCGKSLEDVIKCWKYKKSKQGNNRYEKEDLNHTI